VVRRLREILLASPRLFADETTLPVLDPGRGKVKKGYAWALARDDRPWGGRDPPAVVFRYAPGRGQEHAKTLLQGYRGIVQCDGYAAYKALAGDVTLAFCWARVRRGFFDLAKGGAAPIATEVLQRVAALYAIEAEIRPICLSRKNALFASGDDGGARSVGNPPSISRSGAGACTTTPVQARQASLGRLVTSTRNRAGSTSSRSALSAPISTSGPSQQGQVSRSGSSTCLRRGKCAGDWRPRNLPLGCVHERNRRLAQRSGLLRRPHAWFSAAGAGLYGGCGPMLAQFEC
jgi:hypothetical protein